MNMVRCLNCEGEFAKYMTQQVDEDTFPSLRDKAKKYGYDQYRVCETCYDALSTQLSSSRGERSHLHPYFQQSSSEVKED